jgi:hypothetical protein
MDELSERFSTLERLDVPDLSDDISRRATQPGQREPARSRMAAAALAFAISAAAIGFLVVAFKGEEPRYVGTPAPAEIDALVQGMRVRWPGEWTLVQLEGRSEDGQAWPMFQLTNYDPGLASDDLCPMNPNLPADGVVLYVQHDLASIAEHYAEWPVDVEPNILTEMGCGQQTTTAWRVGGARFQASLAFGPEASAQDRDALLRVFRNLQVEDPEGTKFWHEKGDSFANTWYVAWGARADDPALATTYLVGNDPTQGDEPRPTRVLALNAGGLGWSPFDFDEVFQSLGDSKHPDRSFVQSWGVVSLVVERVLLRADDGREFELTVGPALDRYGLPGRPTYLEFEPPLLGEYVALGPDGEILGRRREENWPPASTTPPPSAPPSPPPQADVRVWQPDAEAKRNLEAIDAAIDGPVLAKGNNWNYPWVVYVSAEGKLTYRDADSISPLPRSASHFRGTRYSFPPDPEILFIGVANQRVAWFGVEGNDGRSIAGSIVPVPDSDLLLVHLTVLRPQSGDRLIARDDGGWILDEQPLEVEGGAP